MTHWPNRNQSCPLTYQQVIDRYFAEHRAKVLDLAAFLDRLDRSQGGSPSSHETDDFRSRALREAIGMLIDGQGDRARRVLEMLSDPTDQPIDHAPAKGAAGAYDQSQGPAQ